MSARDLARQRTPRPPRTPPITSIHIGLSRVRSMIAAAATVRATARQLVPAARAITVPLAMTSPMITGTQPKKHDALPWCVAEAIP